MPKDLYMKIKFWGVRGSIPSPLTNEQIENKLYKTLYLYNKSKYYKTKNIQKFLKNSPFHVNHTYGGNTACIEINCNDELIILDAGSGIRALGLDILKRSDSNKTIHLFISHTHWDHICGFPFFVPALITGKKIKIYSPLPDIKERMIYQQDFRFFPVELEKMASDMEFIILPENKKYNLNGIDITNFKQNHPGYSFGYSFEYDRKKMVYSSDIEIFNTAQDYYIAYENFINNADILIFDAQYSLQESLERISWGHSSDTMGVELALKTHIKSLVFFHHEPRNSDELLYNNLKTTIKFRDVINSSLYKDKPRPLDISNAYEDMELNI